MNRIFTLVLVVIGFWAHAFEGDKTFLDAEFNPVNDIKEAKYYRTVEPANPLYYTEIHFITNELQMKGQYLDSTLTVLQGECFYYYKNGQLESSGHYVNGKKLGIWKRYTENGQRKENRYHPSEKELKSSTKEKNSLATFDATDQSWAEFVQSNLTFPEKARLHGYESAEVNVNLFINASGEMIHFEILSCPHRSFFIETIKLMAEMPLWTPASKSGKPVPSNYIVKVNFDQLARP